LMACCNGFRRAMNACKGGIMAMKIDSSAAYIGTVMKALTLLRTAFVFAFVLRRSDWKRVLGGAGVVRRRRLGSVSPWRFQHHSLQDRDMRCTDIRTKQTLYSPTPRPLPRSPLHCYPPRAYLPTGHASLEPLAIPRTLFHCPTSWASSSHASSGLILFASTY
jgi:hypothetical protein